jgi:signal peptidase II|tara:strand:- start:415 stop:906 length:492 start_codon:yes stop_codon:yes gene_type:complete
LIDLRKIKNTILKKENFYFLATIFFIFGIDRYSKIEIINNFSDTSVYLNDFLNFDLIWNTGIGFGFLSTNSTLVYNLVTILIILVILFIISIFVNSERLDKLIYSIVIGGALGNLYDRLVYKAVPDFIDIHYNNFHWFTFNVADIFITIGILILILRNIFVKN